MATERDLLIAKVCDAIFTELDNQHENAEIDAAGYWDRKWGRLDGEPNWNSVAAAAIDALTPRKVWVVLASDDEGDQRYLSSVYDTAEKANAYADSHWGMDVDEAEVR